MPKQQQFEYVMGLKVRGTTCNEHMTIAYLGCTITIPEVKLEISVLKNLPTKVLVSGHSKLGPENDIDVLDLKFNNESEYFSVKKLWKSNNVEQDHTTGLTEPHLHLTQKKESPERKINSVIEFDRFFIKRIGSREPYLVIELE